MSKKDYEAIAEILWKAKEEAHQEGAKLIVSSIASDLCDLFQRDSSSFDRQRFLAACGQ